MVRVFSNNFFFRLYSSSTLYIYLPSSNRDETVDTMVDSSSQAGPSKLRATHHDVSSRPIHPREPLPLDSLVSTYRLCALI